MQSAIQDQRQLLLDNAQRILSEFADAAVGSEGDISKVEEAFKAALLDLRKCGMSAGVGLAAEAYRRTRFCPDCGEALHSWQRPDRTIVTSEGEATYTPLRCRCTACSRDYYPLEEANGLSEGAFTTGAMELVAATAADFPYTPASEWVLRERGVPVSPKQVDRIVREVARWRELEEEQLSEAVFGTKAAELRAVDKEPLDQAPSLYEASGWREEDRALISVDGAMVRSCNKGDDDQLLWFEHRAGVIAAIEEQSRGEPVIVGGVYTPDVLFDRMAAAWRQAKHCQRECVFVADGSEWIWARAGLYFPEAIQVLDIYHAGEHVSSAASFYWGEGSDNAIKWRKQARQMLLADARGVIRQIITMLRAKNAKQPEALRRELRYLFKHRHRMRYEELAAQGLPVGSGKMESCIKQLSTRRLNQPGMKWTQTGADAVLKLRAARMSGSYDATIMRRHKQLMDAVPLRYRTPGLRLAA